MPAVDGPPCGSRVLMSWSVCELWTCLSLVCAALVQCLRAAGIQTTPATLLRTLCKDDTCRNGECYIVHQSTHCVCQRFYRGELCQDVDLSDVTYAMIGTMVIFQWATPPRLKNYAFIYYESDRTDLRL